MKITIFISDNAFESTILVLPRAQISNYMMSETDLNFQALMIIFHCAALLH